MPAPKTGGLYKTNCRQQGFVEASPSRGFRDGEATFIFNLSHTHDSSLLSGLLIGCKLLARVKPMSEKHLIAAIDRKYKELPRKKRVAIIREFATRSAADKRFFRRYFRELFNEAFPTSSTGARPGSARRRTRRATPR
jgi:hypothetical protein